MNITRYTKLFSVSAALFFMSGGLMAQEESFDLSSQRSEIQDVLPVPGKKIDHNGIVINPTPQQMSVNREYKTDISKGFRISDRKNSFAQDLGFLTQNNKGTRISIDFGKKAASRNGVRQTSGAYSLVIDKKGITITGYDERGAFYGLQSLSQLLASPVASEGTLPYIEINDYPDLADRGVVEGFYGTPWSHEVRKSLIDFYGKFKLNTYLYGPKDDPYHSCPNWRLPYPENEAANIRELVEACNRNRVDFVWAIHPGQDIKWNEEDYANLVNKFNMMYELGVRHFAIFFDDISGEGTNPLKQTELLNRLTDDFVKEKGDVSPLTVCPTDYSRLWANPTENGSLAIYGRTLNKDIKVFWTGDVVCSDMTEETMDWVNSRIKRPAYYWWNFPVTDYVRNILLQGPVYGLDTSLTSQDVCGVVSNPMEHGEASKLALYGVADYTWNIGSYNAIDNWERGLELLVPEAKEAYRTFAIHSSDTETGYRRDESWETETFRISEWTDEVASKLEKEFEEIEMVSQTMEEKCSNKLLLNELRPWLTEFSKLGARGRKTIELARIYRSNGNDSVFWTGYVKNLMSKDDRKNYEAHKSGTMKLQPFYENAMDDMAHGFMKKITGQVPNDYRGIGSFGNSNTILTKLMLDNDLNTHYTSGAAQKAGDWIGVDLRDIRSVSEVEIHQGRNSVDDVDYFDNVILEYSANGKDWYPMTEAMEKQYDIIWKGDAVMARYIRIKRLDSKRTNYASVRVFNVNPVRIENLGFKVSTTEPEKAAYAFDNNPGTSFINKGTLGVEVKEGTEKIVMLMNEIASPVICRQIDGKGKVISQNKINSAYAEITLADNAAMIEIEGNAEIFEIISKDKQ